MEQKVRLNVNIDSELKNETAKKLNNLGMNFITAIKVYFKQIVKRKKSRLKFQMPVISPLKKSPA